MWRSSTLRWTSKMHYNIWFAIALLVPSTYELSKSHKYMKLCEAPSHPPHHVHQNRLEKPKIRSRFFLFCFYFTEFLCSIWNPSTLMTAYLCLSRVCECGMSGICSFLGFTLSLFFWLIPNVDFSLCTALVQETDEPRIVYNICMNMWSRLIYLLWQSDTLDAFTKVLIMIEYIQMIVRHNETRHRRSTTTKWLRHCMQPTNVWCIVWCASM